MPKFDNLIDAHNALRHVFTNLGIRGDVLNDTGIQPCPYMGDVNLDECVDAVIASRMIELSTEFLKRTHETVGMFRVGPVEPLGEPVSMLRVTVDHLTGYIVTYFENENMTYTHHALIGKAMFDHAMSARDGAFRKSVITEVELQLEETLIAYRDKLRALIPPDLKLEHIGLDCTVQHDGYGVTYRKEEVEPTPTRKTAKRPARGSK